MSEKRSGAGPRVAPHGGGQEPPLSVEMSAVQSSSVARVGFDAAREELHVQFRTSENVYIYEGVASEVHAELMASDSKGGFINTRIKNVYPFRVQHPA